MRSKTFLGIFCCCLLLSSCEFIFKEPAEGKINYLVIGTTYTGTRIRALSYTDDDAKSLADTIEALGEAQSRETSGMLMLQDQDHLDITDPLYPTKNHVLEQLTNLKETASDQDLTVFFFSGHGAVDMTNIEDGSLCFVEVQGEVAGSTVEELYANQAFSVMQPKELLAMMNSIPGKKLIILDSCYSGAIADDYGVTHNTDTNVGDIWDAYFSDSQYGLTDLYMLTAASSQTTSTEYANLEHGVFTYYLLKGLGWTADGEELSTPAALDSSGYVTLDSLYAYILPNAQEVYPLQHATTNGTADNLVLFKY